MNEKEIRKALKGATIVQKLGKPFTRPNSHKSGAHSPELISERTHVIDYVKAQGTGKSRVFYASSLRFPVLSGWRLEEIVELIEKGTYLYRGDTYILTQPADPASATSTAETATAETAPASATPVPTPTPRRTKRDALQSLIDGVVNNEPPTATSPNQEEPTATSPAPSSEEPTPPAPSTTPVADAEPGQKEPGQKSPHYPDLKGLDLTPEQYAKLLAIRTQKVGRPKGALNGEVKKPADRATFIVPRELTQKLKLIALYEGRLYKDVVADALTLYATYYEEVHGVIPIKF